MSSISQMERSSSQTKMLPMRPSPPRRYCASGGEQRRVGLRAGACLWSSQSLSRREATQSKHEHAALTQLGAGPNLTFVGLDDLVDNSQTQTGTAFELRLERLEHFLD